MQTTIRLATIPAVLAMWISISVVCRTPTTAADKPVKPATQDKAAGRTFAEWTQQLTAKQRIARLRAARTLPVFGERAIPVLTESLDSDDSAIVYWAAYGLGDIGRPAPKAIQPLKLIVKSKSEGLRIAAAYALCRLGHVKDALPALTRALKSPHRGTANSAADFLARIGPPAKAALPALNAARDHKDYHVKNAANEAIRRITAKPAKPVD